MQFHPSDDLQEQYQAFLALFEALAETDSPETIPKNGQCTSMQAGVLWSWTVKPKAGSKDAISLWENKFKRKAEQITFDVPLNTVDVNDLGLVAKTDDGRAYLCRQTLPQSKRLSATPNDPFADNWTGPNYQAFSVTGTPSTRTYFACIPLSDGPDTVRNALLELLDGLRNRNLASEKRRTKNKALEIMSRHYQDNKHQYPPNIKERRDEIVNLLIQGVDVEDAFDTAQKNNNPSPDWPA